MAKSKDFIEDSHLLGQPYDVAISIIGRPDSGERLIINPIPREVMFLDGMLGSEGYADTPPSGEAIFEIKKNFVVVATMTFATGDKIATFQRDGVLFFDQGDILTVTAPIIRDSTLSDVGISLKGFR